MAKNSKGHPKSNFEIGDFDELDR